MVVDCVLTRLNLLLEHFDIELVFDPSFFISNWGSFGALQKEATRILLGCHVGAQLSCIRFK